MRSNWRSRSPGTTRPPTTTTPDGPRSHDVRYIAIAVLALATLVVLLGGYVGHWAWTGFDSNGQLWDWMHLLLLPVAFGTFPLWLRFSADMHPVHRRILGASALAFMLFVLAGYLAPLVWTGFQGQTLWSWLTLIVLPITITTVRAWPTTGREVRRRPRHRSKLPRNRMDHHRRRRLCLWLDLDRLCGQHAVGLATAAPRAHRNQHIRGSRAHQARLGQCGRACRTGASAGGEGEGAKCGARTHSRNLTTRGVADRARCPRRATGGGPSSCSLAA